MLSELPRRIEALVEQRESPVIIAIDGPCGGGKSTLAKALYGQFPGSLVIHADDFFLQPPQRTPERLKEPGGNLDRERLLAEVLKPLRQGSYLGHRRYDCQTGEMAAHGHRGRFSVLPRRPASITPPAGTHRTVPCADMVIIEGSYSHHPDLRGYYDLTVFLDIDGQTQLQRLRARNQDDALFERFKSIWIPMENTYFAHFHIRERADIRLNAGHPAGDK